MTREVLSVASVSQPRFSAVTAWPSGSDTLRYELDDALFVRGTSVRVQLECSWDSGATWPWQTEDVWEGGAKARDGSAPSVTLGPFKVAHPNPRTRQQAAEGIVQSPTHVRFTMQSQSDLTPVCGLRMNE